MVTPRWQTGYNEVHLIITESKKKFYIIYNCYRTIRNAMKTVFDFVSILFLVSFLISLFIKPVKRKLR